MLYSEKHANKNKAMNGKHLTDSDIINGIKGVSGSRIPSENYLYQEYSYFITEGKRKYSLTEEDAFTAYSDAVITVIHNIHNNTYEGRSSLKSYLFSIFSNKSVDIIRKNTTNKSQVHRTDMISEKLHLLADNARSVIQQLMDKADIDLIRLRLQEIGDNCRKMLLLHADGFSDKEIAIEMEYRSADVAKTSRLRCLDKLRQLYSKK